MSINIHNKEDKAYMILGAPHSATSFIAKALKACGVTMRFNMMSFFQSAKVVELNDKILRKAGGRWNDPPSEENILKTDFEDEIKRVISEKKEKMWAIKDPRFSLTGKKFLKHMEGDVYLICCFRKPRRVIESYKYHRKKEYIDKKFVDKYNKSIIKIIKDFCEL